MTLHMLDSAQDRRQAVGLDREMGPLDPAGRTFQALAVAQVLGVAARHRIVRRIG